MSKKTGQLAYKANRHKSIGVPTVSRVKLGLPKTSWWLNKSREELQVAVKGEEARQRQSKLGQLTNYQATN